MERILAFILTESQTDLIDSWEHKQGDSIPIAAACPVLSALAVAVDTDGRLYYLLPRVYTWSHYMCCYWCVMTQLCVHGRTHMCEGIACVGRGVVG